MAVYWSTSIMYTYILLFAFCSGVLCQDCVTENFENDIGIFTVECESYWEGTTKPYSSTNVTSPHPASTRFVALGPEGNCMASEKITITAGGVIEFKAYLAYKPEYTWAYILVQANGSPTEFPTRHLGWQNITYHVRGGNTPWEDNVLISMNPKSSYLMIDSFRYYAPSVDEDSCVIYPTTTITSTEEATAPTTISQKETSKETTTSTGGSTTNVATSMASSTTGEPPSKSRSVYTIIYEYVQKTILMVQ